VEADSCKKELVIEIPVDDVRREAETITAQFQRRARIPGFRPGHAPATLVERHYRDDIRNGVVESLVPKFFENAVKEQNWKIAGQPHFQELKFEDNQPLTLKASFEVYPQIELKDYKGLEIEEESPAVTDQDLASALEELREKTATLEVVEDRPAEEGDYLAINYHGRFLDASGSAPVEARDAVVHLGAKGTVKGFSENLTGARPGDVREFQVAYPEDFPQKSLAGKTLGYRVEVQSIKHKVVPPLDDELAKSASEFSTLEELRGKLREDLKKQRELDVAAETKQKLVDLLLKAQAIPVPEVLVEAQLDRKMERSIRLLLAQGIDPRAGEIDWRKIRQDARPAAEDEARAALLLEKIAEAEKIEVSEEELDEMIRQFAQEGRETPAALKTRLTRDGELDRLKSTRRNQKALEFIYRNAKISRKSAELASPA